MPDVSYPALLKRVKVRCLELGLRLVLMLGLAVSVRVGVRAMVRMKVRARVRDSWVRNFWVRKGLGTKYLEADCSTLWVRRMRNFAFRLMMYSRFSPEDHSIS